MSSILVQLSEATAARRRMYFHCVDATDGITPETGEAAGQPQISKNGGAWANTSATLSAIGNGRYYVELTAGEVDTLGVVEGRYKSANTAESIGTMLNIVSFDPYDAVRMGLTALPNANADAAGGLPISDAGDLDLDTKLANTNEVTAARMGALTDWIDGGRLDLLLDAIPTTAMRGTDNAALASVCTEARLSELDAANLPTDIAAVPTVDEIWAKAMSDLAAVPGITDSVLSAINWMYCLSRNKTVTDGTNSEIVVYKDDGTTKLAESDISDDGTDFTKGEMGAPD